MKKSEVKMTEKEFISKFKQEDFELYKTKDLKPKLRAFYKMQNNNK